MSNLTGTQIDVGDPLGVIVNNDGVPGDGEEVEGAGETDGAEESDYVDTPTRPSASIPQIAMETGLTTREVKDAIHAAKDDLPSGTNLTNPDVVVDLDTGEIYPQGPGGTFGDSIGNIHD